MIRLMAVFLTVTLLAGTLAPAARAASGDQPPRNPVIETAKSAVWGGLGGFIVGCAVALATKDTDNDGEAIRWGFVGGTFLGLGFGIYQAASQGQKSALLEIEDGHARLRAALPEPAPGGGLTMRLVAARF